MKKYFFPVGKSNKSWSGDLPARNGHGNDQSPANQPTHQCHQDQDQDHDESDFENWDNANDDEP